MSEPIYRLEGIVKRYADREVCRVDSLEVPEGSVLVVMGPNGAGKSTLLRMMGFLEPVTSGTILFRGQHCSNGKDPSLELRRRVTMVFQSPAFFHSSVERNVAYGLEIRGERDVRDRVMEMLETVGLLHLAKAKVSTLSGGEAQRVALARALVFHPEVLLLDEPTANLDPSNVAMVEKLIAKFVDELGTTVVLVTQNIFQAKRMAHQVALMLGGKLIEVGTSDKLFSHPDDSRTLAFVRGEMVY